MILQNLRPATGPGLRGWQWVCDYSETSVDYMLLKADNPELSPRSGMKNAFFTGEDIFAHGLTPLNGIITASAVTGKNLIRKFKKVSKKMK